MRPKQRLARVTAYSSSQEHNGSLRLSLMALFVAVVTSQCRGQAVAQVGNASRCSDLEACVRHPHCRRCLQAVGPFAYAPFASAAKSSEQGFFSEVKNEPSCATTLTAPSMLQGVFVELQGSISEPGAPCAALVSSLSIAIASVGECQLLEYECFTDDHCRQCLTDLYHRPVDTSAALASIHCEQTDPEILNNLYRRCRSFPQCTYSKVLCQRDPTCVRCWQALDSGNPTLAAALCRSNATHTVLLDNLVSACVGKTELACSFWNTRCGEDPVCRSCLAAVSEARSVDAMVRAATTESCEIVRITMDNSSAVVNPDAVWFGAAVSVFGTVLESCPTSIITDCQRWLTFCVVQRPLCAECINGSASGDQCSALLNSSGFNVDRWCQACPKEVHVINTLVLATSVVGSLSAVSCFAVVLVIVSRSRDRVSMQSRVICALMIANAVYSTANCIPINSLKTGPTDCGQLALPFSTIRFGRAWWFLGKYTLVFFEIYILAASSWALARSTRALPPCVEAALHLFCVLGGTAAFLGFYFQCAAINNSGYNSETQTEAQDNAYTRLSDTDDLDDDQPDSTALSRFVNARTEYDGLVRLYLLVWDGLLGVAIMMWLQQRWTYASLVHLVRVELEGVARGEAQDAWASTRKSMWETRRRFIELQLDVYDEVARPLDLYVVIFILYGIVAVMMSTEYCQADSGASATETSNEITYGICDVSCEFALSFRSLSTVFVFFMHRSNRAELFDVRTTMMLLCARIRGSTHATKSSGPVECEALPLDPCQGEQWVIAESELTFRNKLAEGAYGAVWEAQWRRSGGLVAVKRLFGSGMYDIGIGDPLAESDLQKECAALQRLDHPNLLKFHGYGTASDGKGFIVTELMSLGSLRAVLQDKHEPLQWASRISIAAQIAQGMEHLHAVPIVHRDLKSANVLVQSGPVAKVGDFGSSRFLRPRPQQFLHSSFTGTTRLVASLSECAADDSSPALRSPSAESILSDPTGDLFDGAMTKGVGTIVYMAPEMFRGDVTYDKAVDVYGFGIIMWELATRETPWHELGADLPQMRFCALLTQALQDGRRPMIPASFEASHSDYVKEMRRCWAGDPADRPLFQVVVGRLHSLVQTATRTSVVKPAEQTSNADSLTEPLLGEWEA